MKAIHLGIIPDGNRRYCKEHGMKLEELAQHWFDKKALKWLEALASSPDNTKIQEMTRFVRQVTELSLYVSSIDNATKRKDVSMTFVDEITTKVVNLIKSPKMFIPEKEANRFTKIITHEVGLKFNFIGDKKLFSEQTKKNMQILRDLFPDTQKKPKTLTINLAVAYDYTKDITNYSNSNNPDYNREQSDIDIVFRSGREKRLSGFFPTKTFYSELFFTDKLWPAVTLEDLNECIEEVSKRQRRFGK